MLPRLLSTLSCLAMLTICRAQAGFDPAIDTIAISNQMGLWKLHTPEGLLIRAAQAVSPALSEVCDLHIQDIHRKPYLFLRGKHRDHPAQGYTVMVQLLEAPKYIWKAGQIYQACWGAECSACGFDEYWGCACEGYAGPSDATSANFCQHLIALGCGLGAVPSSPAPAGRD